MLWAGFGFTAIGWMVSMGSLWAEMQCDLAAVRRGETPRALSGFGCLLMPAFLSMVVGVVLLFVHAWPWGAGALVASIVWVGWGRAVAVQGFDPELMEEVLRRRTWEQPPAIGGDEEE